MKPEQHPLLQAILSGEEGETLRQASLGQGLQALRQHRRRRHIARLAVLTALPLVALVVVLFKGQPQTHTSQTATSAERTSDIEYINDEQLFALFPDRALALVGKPGQQQLLFLGQARKASSR